MEPTQAEPFDVGKQTHAEIEALRNLWMRMIPSCTPTRDATHGWLKQLSYYEVAKCIHATERLHRKYAGELKPWQLFKYMEQCVNKARKETMEPTANEATPAPESKPKRAYKKRLSKSAAEKAITELIVTHKYVKRDILSALKQKECSPGTNSRLAYLKALQQLGIEFAEQMTKMGVLPKNVQAQTKTEYVFKAHVSKGGGVQTFAVDSKQQLLDITRAEEKEYKKGVADSPEDEAIREQLEAEYGDGAVQPEKK